MADMNSNGLFRYGHFTSSKRSMDNDEPLYLNLFTVSIQADDLPLGMGYSQDDVNIVLEGLRSVDGLQTQVGLGSPITQKYKFADRGFTGAQPSQTHLNVNMNFELNVKREDDGTNNNYTYKFLRKWHDIVYDPQTGRMSIKKNYVCKRMVITMQDKEGLPYWQWTLHNVFPYGQLAAPQLSYDGQGIMQNFQVQFWADYFDEGIS